MLTDTMALGLAAEEGQKQVYVDLGAARHLIDTLIVLRDKTKGNLTADEDANLSEAIAELQRVFAVRATQVRALSQPDLFAGLVVADFMIDKDALFARLTLSDDEFALYQRVWAQLRPQAPTPDLVIYLQASPATLVERVRRRNVAYERNIPDDYLVSLFGPKVLDALTVPKAQMEKTRAGARSELMDLLIAYRWKEMFGGLDRDPATIEWDRS